MQLIRTIDAFNNGRIIIDVCYWSKDGVITVDIRHTTYMWHCPTPSHAYAVVDHIIRNF